MIYRGHGFLTVIYDLAPPPPSPPSSVSKLYLLYVYYCLYVSPVELTGGRGSGEGVEEEPNHTTAKKPGPL
jgi:hypothetical protein